MRVAERAAWSHETTTPIKSHRTKVQSLRSDDLKVRSPAVAGERGHCTLVKDCLPNRRRLAGVVEEV